MRTDAPLSALTLGFDGRLLHRDFWIYVWEIRISGNRVLYYVGRTGDSSSPNAGSPIRRMGSHFSRNPRGRALLRNLAAADVEPTDCHFKMFAFGPVYPEQESMDHHRPLRDRTATLESLVADQLAARGEEVLGSHPRPRVPKSEVQDLADQLVNEILK